MLSAATLTPPHPPPVRTETRVVEPDDQWKANLRKRIENDLLPMISDAEIVLNTILNSQPSESSRERAHRNYEESMNNIRTLAQEEFTRVLHQEISERKRALPIRPDTRAFEPDDQWKADLRKRIEHDLLHMVLDAKRVRDTILNSQSSQRIRARAQREYDESMNNIRTLAQEEYIRRLRQEMSERKWALDVVESNSPDIARQQQWILDNIRKADEERIPFPSTGAPIEPQYDVDVSCSSSVTPHDGSERSLMQNCNRIASNISVAPRLRQTSASPHDKPSPPTFPTTPRAIPGARPSVSDDIVDQLNDRQSMRSAISIDSEQLAARWGTEARRKEDEANRREEEASRKEEEARRLEEKAQQSLEEARRLKAYARQADAKVVEAATQRKEAEAMHEEAEAKKHNAAALMREVEAQRQEEAIRSKEEAKRFEEEYERKKREIERQKREIELKEAELKKWDAELSLFLKENAAHLTQEPEEAAHRALQKEKALEEQQPAKELTHSQVQETLDRDRLLLQEHVVAEAQANRLREEQRRSVEERLRVLEEQRRKADENRQRDGPSQQQHQDRDEILRQRLREDQQRKFERQEAQYYKQKLERERRNGKDTSFRSSPIPFSATPKPLPTTGVRPGRLR